MALQLCLSITCELVTNANSWTPPKFLNQRLCRWGLAICATRCSADELWVQVRTTEKDKSAARTWLDGAFRKIGVARWHDANSLEVPMRVGPSSSSRMQTVSILSKCTFHVTPERLAGCLWMSKHDSVRSFLYVRPTLFGNLRSEFRNAYMGEALQSFKQTYQKANQMSIIVTWESPKFKLITSIVFIFKAHQL